MSLSLGRAALRRPQNLVRGARRYATATEQATQTAKETASKAQSAASEGLSKVQSTAGSVASSASNAASQASGTIGRTIGFFNSLIPPTIHYSKVAWELSRIVFENRKMSLPSGAQFQTYYNQLLGYARNPSSISSAASSFTSQIPTSAQSAQSLRNADWTGVAVVTAEVLGFFTIGEMIGRLKLVGYRGGNGHAEHH